MSGWIKLHRAMTDWEWYDDINCFRVFTHLILVANHKPNKWRGNTIERGERLSSISKLSLETGLTVSQVRTAISKLESTGEIASQSQAQHTVFKVKNYDLYQCDDKPIAKESQTNDKPIAKESQTNDKPIAKESQTNSKGIATNKNDKNVKKEKNEIIDIDYTPFHQVGFDEHQVSEIKRIRKANKGGTITQRVINTLAGEFAKAITTGMTLEGILNEWELRGWKSFKSDWTDAAKQATPKWGNRNTLVEGGAYSQKTADAIAILNDWEPPED